VKGDLDWLITDQDSCVEFLSDFFRQRVLYDEQSMTDDAKLLRDYAKHGSEAAFGELVKRYVDLVYSTALRQVNGDTHLAQDVAQSVFIDLTRRAGVLPTVTVLGGWLYRHTSFTAAKAIRTERRRQARETQAVEMNALNDPSDTDAAWRQVAPVLDEAMQQLGARDRDAIVLRYFERRDLRAVGAALGTNEDAAQKRVSRALEKLRAFLTRRGITFSAAVLATTIASQAVTAAPVGLAISVTGTALAGAAAGGGITLTLLKLMSMTKFRVGVLGALVVVGLATPLVVQHRTVSGLREENGALRKRSGEFDQLLEENAQLAKLKVDADELERLRRERSELIRLRGEVGRLRREIESLNTRAPISGAIETPPAATNRNPVRQITIETKFVVGPADLLTKLGMPYSGGTSVLNDPQVRVLLKTLEQSEGVEVLSGTKCTTLSGRQTEVSVTDNPTTGEEPRERKHSALGAIATVGADDRTINLVAYTRSDTARIASRESGLDLPALLAEAGISSNVSLQDGQTLVASKMIDSTATPKALYNQLLVVLVTPVVVDPAGNRFNSVEE